VVCRQLGPPERMAVEEIPSKPLIAGQVRVRLRAAGVNFPDILMAAGAYQLKPALPFTPGFEAAGEVVEVGSGVAGIAAGDRVMVHQRHGCYAEEAVVEPAQVLPLPQGFGFVEGAAFLVGYHTAYHALVQRAHLASGETLLVHGAAGGVGLAAVEIGKLLGATVIATASTEAKLAAAKSRGADHGINYEAEAFPEAVKRLTAGAGADVIYDPVGGAVFERSLHCIAWGGRLLTIGFASGILPSAPANIVLIKGCSVVGVRAGEAGRRNPALRKAALEALLALAGSGKLKPHISHVLPLERFAEAMRLLSDRKAIGRVVLTMEQE
jgi:NADPH:quinone reductase